MLSAENLFKSYKNGENILYALNDVSLTVNKNEFVVILGPSGSGKSTLLNALSGLEAVDSGSINYNGLEICGLSDKDLTAFRRKKVGFVFQSYYLLPALTAESNIKMGANLSDTRDVSQIIGAVGLNGKEKRLPHELSGGEQQRVSIARAVAKKPEILFCDEPTGALDEASGRQILKYLLQLKKSQGLTIVMVTHNANIARLADKVVRMNSGKIIEVLNNPSPALIDEIDW